MELSKEIVDAKSAEYLEEQTDEQIQLEQRLLNTLPHSFTTGSIAFNDIIDIIEWKASRNRTDFKSSNEPEYVVAAVDLVTQNIPTALKINILSTLNWVQVPTASAILMFVNPQKYTVIDQRAWRTLHKTGELTRGEADQTRYNASDYEHYLSICRQLSVRYDTDLRTLDRALFQLDKSGPEIHREDSDT